MRLWQTFIKSMKEQARDILTLGLSLILAPCFVFIYSLFFSSGGSTSYQVAVINQDIPVLAGGNKYTVGVDLIDALDQVTYSDGQPFLDVIEMETLDDALQDLEDRAVEIVVVLPENLSQTMIDHLHEDGTQTNVEFYGDLTNPYYAVAAVFANAGIENFVQAVTGEIKPIAITEFPLGDSAGRSEFEIYVPGMLVLSIVLLIFQVAMTVAYEVESGTLERLKITRITSFDFLGGISLSIILIGALSLSFAILAAVALGFTSHGSLWVAYLVGIVTTFSIIGVGLLVAAFSKTVSQAFVIANFPLVIFMFFTGVAFPIRKIPLFSVGQKVIGLDDLLPPTHAVSAFNKVLTLGAGLSDIAFELVVLILLTLVYFVAGVFLFRQRHMRIG